MSGRGQPPERVPTLTEVVDPPPGSLDWLPAARDPAASEADSAAPSLEASAAPMSLPTGAPVIDTAASAVASPALAPVFDATHDEAVARRVIAEVEAHIDRVLDARIRSALAPLLQALATQVVADTRRELASTLRDALARAMAQESARHRAEPGPR